MVIKMVNQKIIDLIQKKAVMEESMNKKKDIKYKKQKQNSRHKSYHFGNYIKFKKIKYYKGRDWKSRLKGMIQLYAQTRDMLWIQRHN